MIRREVSDANHSKNAKSEENQQHLSRLFKFKVMRKKVFTKIAKYGIGNI